MKIVNGFPPNFAKIKKAFKGIESQPVVLCYGDTIYNIHGGDLEDHLIHHESIHTKQQGKDIEGWWNKYIKDLDFRIEQEVTAYGAQLKFIRRHYGLPKVYPALNSFAKFLSGPVYKSALTWEEAYSRIAKALNE